MSIFAYVGLPRSGKSYTAVEQQILPALRAGRIVVTNLPLKRDAIVRDIPGAAGLLREFSLAAVEANPDSIFEVCPNGAVIVLDEVWRFWPAGKKVDKIPEAFKSFLAEHGHRVDAAGNSQQIVLVTQNLGQIAAFARQQIEQTFWTLKLTMIGSRKRFRTDVYAGAPTGTSPPESARLRQIFGRYEPRVYQYYTSHTMSEAGEGGANEAAIDGRGNILLRPMMLAAPFVVLGLVWFGFTHLHRPKHEAVGEALRAGSGAAAAAPPAAPALAPGGNAKTPRYWVSSVMRGVPNLGDVAMVTDGEVTVWLELRDCRVSKFDVACPYAGRMVTMRGHSRPGLAGPVSVPGRAPASTAGAAAAANSPVQAERAPGPLPSGEAAQGS